MMRKGGFLIRGGGVAFLLTMGLLACPIVLFAVSAEENYKWYCQGPYGSKRSQQVHAELKR
jgi:hypothetical protein